MHHNKAVKRLFHRVFRWRSKFRSRSTNCWCRCGSTAATITPADQNAGSVSGTGLCVNVLFGRDGLGEVPQFEGVVLRHGDQTRLDRVEGQRSDAVEVAPQCVFRVPRLPERRLLIGRQLRYTDDRLCD